MKARLRLTVAVGVALSFVGAEIDATDCRTAFKELKAKERRERAIACAKAQYEKDKQHAKTEYEAALRRATAVIQPDQEAQGIPNAEDDAYEISTDRARIHRVLIEEAQESFRRAEEDARKERDETVRLFTKQGVFTYGAGVAALFPGGERRVIDARLDAEQKVVPLAYAQEQLSPVAVVTYFPRDLTWGMGNRRWGFGPMVVFGENGPWEEAGLGAMIGVTRSGDSEGPLSFGLGIAYYLDNRARTLRDDFRAYETSPGDGNEGHLLPLFVETTGHSVSVVITVSIWDRAGTK